MTVFDLKTLEFPSGDSDRIRSRIVDVPRIQLSTRESSQLDLKVSDPHLELVGKPVLKYGTAVYFNAGQLDPNSRPFPPPGIFFVIDNVILTSEDGVPTLNLKATNAGTRMLKRAVEATVHRNISPTKYARDAATLAGLKFVGEETANRPQIGPTPDQRPEDRPSKWDVIQNLAAEQGFVAFEMFNTLYFARPTWLLDRASKIHVVRYRGELTSWEEPKAVTAIGLPSCERIGDVVRIEVSVDPRDARDLKPTQRLDFTGVPSFGGKYLITSVEHQLDGTTPVAVTAETPVDPEPQPPAAEPGYQDGGPPIGGVAYLGATTVDGGGGYGASRGWVWPTSGRITSRFGPRGGRLHAGLDIAAPTGTRIVA